jgi:S1-C subfamily serine protease
MNPGSSGGPLLNGEGAMVGIVVGAVPDAQGIYFAVSAQHVKELTNR